jgi:hypothetical protein
MDFTSFRAMVAFFILLVAPLVAGRDCKEQSPPLPFPPCTVTICNPFLPVPLLTSDKEHTFNDEQIGNICIENLSGICARPNGTYDFFDSYGASLLKDCPSDDDRYGELASSGLERSSHTTDLIHMFQSECASVSRTITSIPGGFSNYLTIDRIGQLQSAFSSRIESTSLTTRSPSTQIVTSNVTPSPTSAGETPAPVTPTNPITTLGSTFSTSASPTTAVSDSSITDAAVLPNSTSATPSNTSAPEAKNTSNKSKTVVAAVCGSVGGFALAAGLLVFYLVRRRKRAGPIEIGGQDSPILAGDLVSRQRTNEKARPMRSNGGAPNSPLGASELDARFARVESRHATELDSPEIYEMDGSSVHSIHGRRNIGLEHGHV